MPGTTVKNVVLGNSSSKSDQTDCAAMYTACHVTGTTVKNVVLGNSSSESDQTDCAAMFTACHVTGTTVKMLSWETVCQNWIKLAGTENVLTGQKFCIG